MSYHTRDTARKVKVTDRRNNSDKLGYLLDMFPISNYTKVCYMVENIETQKLEMLCSDYYDITFIDSPVSNERRFFDEYRESHKDKI